MSTKSKLHKIIPGSIRKRMGSGMMRPIPTVEDALTEVGKCCGVDLCEGVVKHYDPISGQTKEYSIQSGVFAPTGAGTMPSSPKTQMMPNVVEHIGLDLHPMHNVEAVLNEQATCCGADCCGQGMIRLPNHLEGVVYEFGVQGTTTIAPRVVAGLKPSKLPKRHYKIFPQSIFKKTVRGQKRVKFFEEIQESMVTKQAYYGFDCCAGSIFLPDKWALGNYYRVSIVAGAFVLTPVDSCNQGGTSHNAVITKADGTDIDPAVITLGGTWETGESLKVNITHSVAGVVTGTHAIIAGPLGATAAATQIAGGLTITSVTVSTGTGASIEFLADTASETLNIDSIVVGSA